MMDDIRRFIELKREKKRLNVLVDAVDEELDGLVPKIEAHFEREGLDNVRMDGATVFVRRQIWAGAKEAPSDVAEVLQTIGMKELVGVNSMKLSANIREICAQNGLLNAKGHLTIEPDKIEEYLPPQLRGLLKFTEKVDISARL